MSGALNPLLAFGAGALTILSPCVLPLVPIVLGSALQKGKWGPLALSGGLVASFTLIGFLVATIGVSAGLDSELIAQIGAVSLVLVGLILLSQRAQDALTRLATPLVGWANERQNSLARFGIAGQAGIGVLLGLVWSPCIGPTLGAATVLAAEGKNLGEVAFVMFAFALGIATVLLLLATATRGFLGRWRGHLMQAGRRGKLILGGLLVLVGIMILTGLDHIIEGILIELSPEWLTELTTTF